MDDFSNTDAECYNFDSVAPNTEHFNKQDYDVKDKPSELFGCFDSGKNKQHSQYELFQDIGIRPSCIDDEELLTKCISDEKYRKLMQSLNEKQSFFIMFYIQ